MNNIKYGMLALAAGFLFQGVTPRTAEAAPVGSAVAAAVKVDSSVTQVRHGGRHFGHHGFRGHRFGGHRHFRHRYWGPGIGIYVGPRWGGGGCGWLRHRALNTGSSYWWRRYNACRHGW